MTPDSPTSKRRVYLWSLVLGLAGVSLVGMAAVVLDGAKRPPGSAGRVVTGVMTLLVLVARDEYAEARREDLGRARSVARAARRTFDGFVLGR